MPSLAHEDNIPLPNNQYDILYSDPPWSYTDKALAGNRGAGCKYNVMTLEDLKKIHIQSISKLDSIMFMWVTFPKLVEGTCSELMREWGFTPKTIAFNWVKYNKKSYTPFMGMGTWTRANSELVMIGTRGNPKRINAGIRQYIEEIEEENYMPEIIQSSIEKHSKKPSIVRERIVDLMGDLSKIELFAREKFQGWDSWGNEIKQ